MNRHSLNSFLAKHSSDVRFSSPRVEDESWWSGALRAGEEAPDSLPAGGGRHQIGKPGERLP